MLKGNMRKLPERLEVAAKNTDYNKTLFYLLTVSFALFIKNK